MSSTRTFLISTCTRSQPCLTQEYAFCPAKELKKGTCYLPQTWKSRGTMISKPVSCLLKVSESKYLNCYEFTLVFRAYFLFSTLPKISSASKHDSLSSFLLPSQHLIVVGTMQNHEWLRIFITGFLTKNLKEGNWELGTIRSIKSYYFSLPQWRNCNQSYDAFIGT